MRIDRVYIINYLWARDMVNCIYVDSYNNCSNDVIGYNLYCIIDISEEMKIEDGVALVDDLFLESKRSDIIKNKIGRGVKWEYLRNYTNGGYVLMMNGERNCIAWNNTVEYLYGGDVINKTIKTISVNEWIIKGIIE